MNSYVKTQGIVLGLVPYSDRITFIHIYTQHFGIVSYAVPLSQGKRAKFQRALFSPLQVLNFEAEHKEGRRSQKLVEVHAATTHFQIQADPIKNALAFFLAEFLHRVIQEQEANAALYDYLIQSIELMALLEEGKANFHLAFMARLASLLGFALSPAADSDGQYFDMLEGRFVGLPPTHAFYLEPAKSSLLQQLLTCSFLDLATLRFNRDQRNTLVEILIQYYSLHLTEFPALKSLEVLRELF